MWQLQLFKWLLLVTLLVIGGEGTPESDPWITPIPNFDAAMEGYDPVLANPFERPDPGMRNQIFEPMRELPDGKVVLNSFIDKVREDLYCDAELSGKTLRNYNEYSQEKSSCYKFSLNADISAKASFGKLFSFKASAGYGRQSSREDNSLQKLFQETKGEIVQAKAECLTHSVGISLFEKPVFTSAFITALKKLHVAAKTPESDASQDVYVNFVQSYGTHFMKTTFLGSKLIFEKRFTKRAINSQQERSRSECVANAAYASMQMKVMKFEAGASFAMSSKGCESSNESTSFFQDNSLNSEKIISIGSLPHGDLEKWSSTVKDSPMPIYYELAKISSLFQSEWFDTFTLDDSDPTSENLNGSAMYDFFEDKSTFFCQLILGEECVAEKTGCGYNSMCSYSQSCRNDPSSERGYICTDGGVVITGGNIGADYSEGMLSTTESINFYDLPSLPISVQSNTLTAIGTMLYSCGGRVYASHGSYSSQKTCYYLDTASSSPIWSTWYTLPGAMSRHTAVNVGQNIWFVISEKLYSLNVASRIMRTYSLPFAVSDGHCAVSNVTHSYVVGVGSSTKQIWVNTVPSDPSQWRFVGDLPIALKLHACLWFGSDVIITGGQRSRNSSYVLDTRTHNLTATEPMNSGRHGHQMMVLDEKPAVVGGWDDKDFLASIETYDMKYKKWSTHSRHLKDGREFFGMAQLNG